MKKNVILSIFIVLSADALFGQYNIPDSMYYYKNTHTDTVGFFDECYMNNAMPDDWMYLPFSTPWDAYEGLLLNTVQSSRYCDTSSPTEVYGVACKIAIELMSDAGGFDSILYGWLAKTTVNHHPEFCYDTSSQMCYSTQPLDYTQFVVGAKGPVFNPQIRQLWFRQSLPSGDLPSAPTPKYLTCYEFYFDSVHHFAAGDTIVVGMAFGLPHYFMIHTRYENADKNVVPFPLGYHAGTSPYSSPLDDALDLNKEDVCFGAWWYTNIPSLRQFGVYYPIVKLRCTTPRNWRMTAIEADSAVFCWDFHDEAESYVVMAVNLTTGAVVTDTVHDPEVTCYTLHGVDTANCQYDVRVRKSTRYTTPTYDTLVYSPWSDSIVFGAPPVGIRGVEGASAVFSLRPNPARGVVELTLGEAAAGECEVTVGDLSGRELLRQRVPSGAKAAKLDVSALAAGTYMVTLRTPDGRTYTQRLVVAA